MAYLAREDGERFVIPSYRDVISKRKAQLKEDILLLSAKYGEYMTFQRRGLAQFEVAFAHEAGYLFGECVWSYFKRPPDLIYCEAKPDTTEAYFVIVKDGGVYLDGIFPLENIIEEVMVFATQKTSFEIYVYGEVPISPEPAEGKFAFEASAVKQYQVLDEPLFQRLPPVKGYQLQLVDVVLRQHGIGVFPVKYVLAVAVLLGLVWMGYNYMNMHKQEEPIVEIPPPPNPFLDYNKTLMAVAPVDQIEMVVVSIMRLVSMPGWVPIDIVYTPDGKLIANIKSLGTNVELLFNWAARNDVKVAILPAGFSLTMMLPLPPKSGVPDKIYPLDQVVASMIDRMMPIVPGNILKITPYQDKKVYKTTELTINLTEVSPDVVIMIAEQLKGLPLVLKGIALKINHGLTGTINLQALGN
jgi:hypothetical protein